MNETLYPGMNFAIQGQLLNDGVKIPISDISNIVVLVYHTNGKMLQRFSMVAKEGFDDANFNVISDPDGTFEVRITEDVSVKGELGDYKVEIKFKFTDSGYIPVGATKIFRFEDAKSANITV
jgi:hypothetical protein